jgi:predicted dehydrogenase
MVKGYYAPMSISWLPGQTGWRTAENPQTLSGNHGAGKTQSWTSTALLSFQEELADFLRMINGETVPLADGFAGFRAVEIANAVYQSSAESRAITLSPKP